LVIFDCNGVLVDSEPIAFAVLVDAFKRVGMILSAETMMRRFHGRRPAKACRAISPRRSRRKRYDACARNCAPSPIPFMP
jgi:beta-phosphoglucomutase-like phosphatase (HAD superfamily)